MSEVAQQAIGKWQGILSALGVGEDYLKNKHGPCPMCDGTDRYRFDDKDGKGTYICGQCGSGDGFTLLMKLHGWDFKQAAEEVEKIVGSVKPIQVRQKPDPRLLLRRIANAARGLNGEDPASRYLEGRGLSVLPLALSVHGGLDYYQDGRKAGQYPAMLARIVDVDGVPLTYHVTYLDGIQKAPVDSPKKIMPPIRSITGGAIRLFPAGPHLGIAEGIESAIAAHELYGIPVWATATAHGMETFKAPAGVERITIFADNDETYTGQKAAYALANKLVVNTGIRVDVMVPEEPGMDFLDQINKQATIARRA